MRPRKSRCRCSEHWERLDEFEGSGYQRVVALVMTSDEGPVYASIYVLAGEAPATCRTQPNASKSSRDSTTSPRSRANRAATRPSSANPRQSSTPGVRTAGKRPA